jgi:hypothetical protein
MDRRQMKEQQIYPRVIHLTQMAREPVKPMIGSMERDFDSSVSRREYGLIEDPTNLHPSNDAMVSDNWHGLRPSLFDNPSLVPVHRNSNLLMLWSRSVSGS